MTKLENGDQNKDVNYVCCGFILDTVSQKCVKSDYIIYEVSSSEFS